MSEPRNEADLQALIESGTPAVRRDALGELLELLEPALFQVTLRMTGRRDLAEEALQETYVRVLHAVAKFRGEAKLSTWIYRIAVREALRLGARRGRQPIALPEDLACSRPGHDVDAAETEAAARLLGLIARLPETQRVAFSLTAVEGLSRTRVAEILDVPVGTVDSRLSAARGALRARLAERG